MTADGYRGITVRVPTYDQTIDLAAFLTMRNKRRVTISEALSSAIEHYKKHLESAENPIPIDKTQTNTGDETRQSQ